MRLTLFGRKGARFSPRLRAGSNRFDSRLGSPSPGLLQAEHGAPAAPQVQAWALPWLVLVDLTDPADVFAANAFHGDNSQPRQYGEGSGVTEPGVARLRP